MRVITSMLLLTIGFVSNASQTVTSSMGSCYEHESQYSTGHVNEADRYRYNRLTVLGDINSSKKVSCFVDMFTDKLVEEIELDFSIDTAARSASANLNANDPNLLNYVPKCKLIVDYSPGGGDFIDLPPAKSVPWGSYDELKIANPPMQYNGNGYLRSAVMECNTGYFADETRFFGLRIKYAD